MALNIRIQVSCNGFQNMEIKRQEIQWIHKEIYDHAAVTVEK